MSNNISAVLSESFDDVLIAVQETQRGRWFLNEYAKRTKHQDTQTILSAIARLESFVAKSPTSRVDAGLIEKAKAAIATAKAQIRAEHKPFSNALTEEARLFAKLAEHARAAITGELSVSKSVDIALNLIDDLDHQLAGTPSEPAQFFKRDEDLFQVPRVVSDNTKPDSPKVEEPKIEAPKPEIIKPMRPVEPTRADVDTVPRGAKLTIHRTALKPTETAPDVASTDAVEEQKADVMPAPTVAVDLPVATTKPRIVITRRKAEDMIDVPLVEQQSSPQTAA